MGDIEIRELEHRLALAKARAGVSTAKELLAELDRISNRAYAMGKRYEKVGGYHLRDEHDRSHKVGYAETLCGGVALLHRRWRRVYREWIRVSGRRAERDRWLGPRPPCVCPPAQPGRGQVHTNCGTFTIVLTSGPKNSWRKLIEYSENSRFITRGRRRKTIMDELEMKKNEQERKAS